MRPGKIAPAVLLAALCTPLFAFASQGSSSALAKSVTRGFAASMGMMDPITLQRKATPESFADLTSPLGLPLSSPELKSGELLRISDTQVLVCLHFLQMPSERWKTAVTELTDAKWRLSSPGKCSQNGSPLVLPSSYPAGLLAYRVLDAEDSPLPTSVAEFPVYVAPAGARLHAIGLPSFTLEAPSNGLGPFKQIQVKNPNLPPDPALLLSPDTEGLYYSLWNEASTRLSTLKIREPFRAIHTCSNLGPQQTCTISVALDSSAMRSDVKVLPGSLYVEFDEKNPTRISIEGTRVLAETVAPPPVEGFGSAYCDASLNVWTSCRRLGNQGNTDTSGNNGNWGNNGNHGNNGNNGNNGNHGNQGNNGNQGNEGNGPPFCDDPSDVRPACQNSNQNVNGKPGNGWANGHQ